MANEIDNTLNSVLDGIANMLLSLIKNFVVGIFYGAKRLKNRKFLIGFGLSFLIPGVWILNKDKFIDLPMVWRYLAYYCGLISPLIYLKIISGINGNKKYEGKFKQLNFYGIDKKLPFLINKYKDEFGLDVLTFQAAISIEKWRSNIKDLEVVLNVSIVDIEPGNRKDRVILKTIPGTIEIPELINWDDKYINPKDGVVVVGKNAVRDITVDLNKTPHVLSAGETGSGKSVTLRCMLWQLISKGAKCFMIDFKGGVEFGKAYEEYGQVITDKDEALKVLQMLTKENELRLKLFREMEVKNLKEFNQKTHKNLCRIAVVVDELAELLDKTGLDKDDKEKLSLIEKELSTLARLSRATGINLLLGVQRPDAKVITGQIKTNVPVRICGRFADSSASEIVLSNTKAKDLPDKKGRFMFKAGAETQEFQAFYFDDDRDLKEISHEEGGMLIDEENDYRLDDTSLYDNKDEEIQEMQQTAVENQDYFDDYEDFFGKGDE